MLWVTPVVEDANLVNTLQRAGRRAPFLGAVFALEVFHGVLDERRARITTLLRAPMDQSIFANVEITGSGPATPLVRLAFGDAVLKPIQPRVVFVSQFLDLLKDASLFLLERLQRAVVIVDHA